MPDLYRLLELIDSSSAYQHLISLLKQKDDSSLVLLDSARPYLLASIYRELQQPVLLITAQPEKARKLQEQLASWCPSGQIWLFPESDVLPYERLASDTTTEIERIQVLSALTSYTAGTDDTGVPLVITPAASLMSLAPM